MTEAGTVPQAPARRCRSRRAITSLASAVPGNEPTEETSRGAGSRGSRAESVIVQGARVAIVAACVAVAAVVLRDVPDIAALREPEACAAPVEGVPEIAWIAQDAARALIEEPTVTFVDARPREEYESGHVAAAINIPMDLGAIDDRTARLVSGARTVVAYCDARSECESSKRLARLLAEAGHPDVRVLQGGIAEWLSNDYPAEAGPCRVCP